MLSVFTDDNEIIENQILTFHQFEGLNFTFVPSKDLLYTLVLRNSSDEIELLMINNDDVVIPFTPRKEDKTEDYSFEVYLQNKRLKGIDNVLSNPEEFFRDTSSILELDFRVIPESFPFKREFLNPETLWENAVTKNLSYIKEIKIPRNSRGWFSVPKRFKWEYEGRTLAIIVPPEAYDKVNVLTDYFSEGPRMNARRMNCSSPYNYYLNNYDKIAEKAIELMNNNKDSNHSFRFYLREAVYELIPECTTFSIEASKIFFQFMNSKIVLDPSSGWGDRILGAAASGSVNTYHGVDPNPSLRKSYDEIIEFIKLNGVKGDYEIITDDFLEVNIEEEKYDTVFTSPPYFSYEIYIEDQKQSISGRVTVQDWLNGFFFPYLAKAWRGLKLNGNLSIYIADTKAGRYVEQMYNFVTNKLHGNFRGIIAVTNPSLDHGYPIWIWRRDRI